MHHISWALLLGGAALVASCGDDDGGARTGDTAVETDTGGDGGGDTAGDSGADTDRDGADDGTPDGTPDADAGDTAPERCAPGERVATDDGESTLLELCGATLAGSAPAGTPVALAVVEAPAPFPVGHTLVGRAFEVSGDGFVGHLTLADDGTAPGYRMAARFEPSEGWLGFEACPRETGVDFPVAPGIYALFRDLATYPDSPRDLGAGTVATTFMGADTSWTFDDGYAIHDAGADGLRSVTIITRRSPSADVLQQLDIRMVEAADHTFTVLQVTLLDTSDLSGGWSWLEPVDGPLALAEVAAEGADGPVVGTFDAPLRKGDAVEVMHVELDVTTERYRFPPEGACLPPEG